MRARNNKDDHNPVTHDDNRDPISYAPGAHPLGTGMGGPVAAPHARPLAVWAARLRRPWVW